MVDATKNLEDAKKKLDKMEKLESEGKASQKAVDLAKAQVVLATTGVATATANLALSAANSAAAASTSLGTGMYGAAYMDTTYNTDFTKTTNEQSVGSSLIVGNNADIGANNNFNMISSILASNNGDVDVKAKEANIKAGENTFQSDFGSKTTNLGVSYGNNGLGMNAGYNQADNFILSNTFTNSEILAKNGTFNLTTTGDTNIKGGNVVADKVNLNIGNNLNLETIQDTYEQQGNNFGISVSGGQTPTYVNNAALSLGLTDIYSKTTKKATGVIELSTNDNTKSEEQNLINLLQNTNSVNVAGTTNNQTQKENITFTNADFEGTLSVPIDLITNPSKVGDAFKNFGTNVKTTVYGATNTLSNVAETILAVNNPESITDTFISKQKEQVVALNRGADNQSRRTLNDLGSKEQNASDIQNALATGVESGKGSKVYYDENGDVSGFHDTEKGDNYINLAKGITDNVTNATNTNSLIFTDAHERAHAITGNENFANMVGNEATTAWNAVNWIYGDSVNTNPNVTPTSWANYNGVGNIPIANANQLMQSSLLNYNNQIVSNINPQDRNNLPADQLMVGSKINSKYQQRISPITGKLTGHYGTDSVTQNEDKSIHVAADGVVKEVRNQIKVKKDKDGNDVITGWGNTVLIQHQDENGQPTYTTRYAHLVELPKLEIGKTLKEGDVLGIMGESGGATGPHLHFELKQYDAQSKDWKYINPETINIGKYNKLSEVPKND